MAESLNTVALVGRLGRDPELRHTGSGKSVTTLSLALNGRGDNDTSWIDVVVWGNQADAAAQHLSKGREVGIVGRLQQRKWKAADGSNRSVVEVVAHSWYFVGPRPDGPPPAQQARRGSNDLPADATPAASDDDAPF